MMDLNLRQWDEAISELEKALALDPNDPACHGAMSWALSMSGRPKEGVEHAKSAIKLDPHNPARYLAHIGLAHFCMGEWQEAVTANEKALKLNPEIGSSAVFLASACAHLGRAEEAKAAAKVWRQQVGRLGTRMFSWPFKDRRVEDSFVEGLLKAGFPSGSFGSIHVSKEDQITGDDLRAFYFPSTTTGWSTDTGEWTLGIAKDGTAILRSTALLGEIDSGRVWLEGDRIWLQFQKRYNGIAYCSTTFRTPTGTPEAKNEYISFTDVGWSRFSRVR
jgi:hypothetical protein